MGTSKFGWMKVWVREDILVLILLDKSVGWRRRKLVSAGCGRSSGSCVKQRIECGFPHITSPGTIVCFLCVALSNNPLILLESVGLGADFGIDSPTNFKFKLVKQWGLPNLGG